MSAIERVNQIRSILATVAEEMDRLLYLLQEAWDARDWDALGYGSWDEYVSGEYSVRKLKIPADRRREIVRQLTGGMMSQRAIAGFLGVDQGTVSRDLAASREASGPLIPESDITGSKRRDVGASPDPSPPPARVTGRDGKSYPSRPTGANRLRPVPSPPVSPPPAPATEPDPHDIAPHALAALLAHELRNEPAGLAAALREVLTGDELSQLAALLTAPADAPA